MDAGGETASGGRAWESVDAASVDTASVDTASVDTASVDTASGSAWLPGADFDRQIARHGDVASNRGWRSRLRWDPGRRGAMALAAAVVAVVAATGWWLAASRPREIPISTSALTSTAPGAASSRPSASSMSSSATTSTSPPSSASSTNPQVVIDVAGKVRHPGIYRLAAGARVYDAIHAAGGARPGVSTLSLDLAALLHDGQQIVVGTAGMSASSGGGSGGGGFGTSASSGSVEVVDLNSATLEQLETLPGVGPVLGQHILDWRNAHGSFASVDQLREVSGIGDVRFAQLRPLVTA